MDIMEMMPLIMYFAIGMMAIQVIMSFLWFIGPRRKFIDRPVDLHGKLYKSRRKAAKANMKGQETRYLHCAGDSDNYDFRYGKIVGMISGIYLTEIFVRTRTLSPARWLIVPKELQQDKHGRHLVVVCNGFEPAMSYYTPIWTNGTPKARAIGYLQMIHAHMAMLIQLEKNGQLIEEGAHGMNESLDVGHVNTEMVLRNDHNPRMPGDETGPIYDDAEA